MPPGTPQPLRRAALGCLAWVGLAAGSGAALATPIEVDEAGLEAVDSGDYPAAVPLLEAAILQRPDDALLHYALAVAEIELGRDDLAVTSLERAAALEPDFPGVQLELGLALYRLGEFDAAEDHLLEALMQGPESAELLFHLALLDLDHGEFDRGIRFLEEAAVLDPRIAAAAYLEAAGVELDREDPAAAEVWLQRAIASEGPEATRERARALLARLHPAPPRRVRLSAGAGVDYDDNLTVSAVDLTTGVGDVAGIFDAGVELVPFPDSFVDVAVGYDFRQSLYRTLSGLDLQSHSPHARVAIGNGRLVGLAAWRYSNDQLGGNAFLSTQRGDLGSEFSATDWLVGIVGLRVEGFTFAQTPERDALRTSIALGVRVLDDVDRIAFGLSWRPVWTDATGPQFDYDGNVVTADLDVVVPLLPFHHAVLDFRLTYDWESRDYTNVTPEIGTRRADERHQFGAGVAIPLIGPTEASLDYLHVSASSNIPELNYGENIVTFRVGAWY